MKKLFAVLLVSSSVGTVAHAGVIVGGSTLLNSASVATLEGWLGEGPLQLTNIFTKQSGNTSANFHLSVDGMGPTFSVMQVTTGTGATAVIGGYDPLSWGSFNGYNLTTDRSAFIFNLTADLIQRQRVDAEGQYQTYNYSGYGPTFGGGHDLYVAGNLINGYSSSYSYGPIFENGSAGFTISALEVFTIAPGSADVPEPAMLGLFGLGALGLGLSRRRKVA